MLRIAVLIRIALLALFASSAQAEVVRVAVAANFAPALRDMAGPFQDHSGHTVLSSPSSSGKLHAQIVNGAPFDLFLSADQAKPLALENAGLSVPGSRHTYARGALVLWSRRDELDPREAAALRHARYNKLALANPRLAPYGAAAVQVLEHLGLHQSSRARWVMGENIAQTYQFVASGNADLGLIALSQTRAHDRSLEGQLWVIPTHWYAPILQDAVLLRDTPAARALLRFMHSETGQQVLRRYGYLTGKAGVFSAARPQPWSGD